MRSSLRLFIHITLSVQSFVPGIVIVLFFQCIGALLNPVNRKKDGVKWLLVAHTVAMFFTATVSLATNLNVEFVSYINNRNYPGVKGQSPPGPLGYYFVPQLVPVEVVSNVTGQLNQWLADCLLVSSASDPLAQMSDSASSCSFTVAGSSTT